MKLDIPFTSGVPVPQLLELPQVEVRLMYILPVPVGLDLCDTK